MQKLSGKQARQLRSLGHHLKPVVTVGKEGINAAVVVAVNEALDAHELIKVKLLETCLTDRHEASEILAEKTGSMVAQVIGRTILLYRAGESGKIVLN